MNETPCENGDSCCKEGTNKEPLGISRPRVIPEKVAMNRHSFLWWVSIVVFGGLFWWALLFIFIMRWLRQ